MTEEYVLFFAYGSNMDVERIKERIHKDEVYCYPAQIDNYKLAFNKKTIASTITYANIEPEPGSKVYGVVYSIGKKDLKKLDLYEGYPQHYDRKIFIARTLDTREERTVYAYTAKPGMTTDKIKVSNEYFNHVLNGAALFDFPDHYVELIYKAAEK